jgi:hypothetical protein
MLDSKARIVEPTRRTGMPTGEAGDAEQAVSFRFPVRWSTVFAANPASPPALQENQNEIVSPNVSAGTRKLHDNSHEPNFGSSAQWEMVVPKMVRSSPRISATIEIVPPPIPRPAARTLQPVELPRNSKPHITRDAVPPLERPRRQAPGWRRRTATLTASLAASLAAKLFLGALAASVAIPVLMRVYRPEPEASIGSSTRGGAWMREISAPAGSKQARQLVLYRPSAGATDCRLEFTWKVSDRALAWTFRAKDKANYYAMAIKALRPGPFAAVSVEHFTVYQGIESQHANKVLILPDNSPALQIKLDVSGATFKLYLEGNAADHWTDNRLTAGALGFLEQPDLPAVVESVRLWFSPAGGA